MHAAEVIAMGYRYPSPGAVEALAEAVESSTQGGVKRHLTQFVTEVRSLSIGAWEELHTTTLDLSPLFVPYVGHVEWGENYRRGEFMSDLNAAMSEAGVDLDGELPDHIAPVLRYLSMTAEPLLDLIQVLPGAVDTMTKTLAKAAPNSPYRHLLAATADFAAGFAGHAERAGGSRAAVSSAMSRAASSGTEFRLRRKSNGNASWAGTGEAPR
ncbi:MAG: nitrate reductase molybdenum cofactor assembly chaperone [Acidimicrobiales bacterium]